MSRQTAFSEAKLLPANERIDLVMEIWDSIELDQWQITTTEEQKAELDRRRDSYEADPGSTSSAEDTLDSIEREL